MFFKRRREIKKLREQIQQLVDNFEYKDTRKHAQEELNKAIELSGRYFPRLKEVVKEYPDFNSIAFRIEQPKSFLFRLNFDIELLKKNPKMIDEVAKFMVNVFSVKKKQERE